MQTRSTSHPVGWLEPESQIIPSVGRMWRKQNPHALLERRADGAAAAENSLAVPRRREQGDHLTQHFPLVLPRRREHTCPHVNLHTDIRTASLVRVERRREPTCAWPGEWKSRVVCPRGGTLPDHDEEWNPYPRFAGLSSEYVMLK